MFNSNRGGGVLHNIYIPLPTTPGQMIPGIGTDVVVITRFKGKTLDHDRHFLERVFTPAELAACFSRGDPAPHLAARFAGKEAVTKALSSIGFDRLAMNKIEITNTPSGVPSVTLISPNASMVTVLVSLSHDGDIAVACAVAMEGDGWKKDHIKE
ncbi:holo-ACP synthase [Methanofollis sp. W23]|uniref:holo-ACP synthase n=1 Tax=Methanofollis sp. W23 TaxID=2817849 RepID=UPI001AE49E03|nr:holo-ACP synthase [Methanofollis sp. W23]